MLVITDNSCTNCTKIHTHIISINDFFFQYLGCTEVFDSRGMQVCEDAVKTLKAVSFINILLQHLKHEKCSSVTLGLNPLRTKKCDGS